MAGGGVTEPGACLSLSRGQAVVEERGKVGQFRVGQCIGEASEIVAFRPFTLHRHGGGQAQHIEEHFGQVVVDVLHLARRQHAEVEICRDCRVVLPIASVLDATNRSRGSYSSVVTLPKGSV